MRAYFQAEILIDNERTIIPRIGDSEESIRHGLKRDFPHSRIFSIDKIKSL